jgi:predicted phage-related endonuclease
MTANNKLLGPVARCAFIGGSDARIIMGDEEPALVRLWREKRGEAEPQDYSGNLIVQLGLATEPLNRRWYEKTTGQVIKNVQSWIRHPVIGWMAATLDGIVEGTGAVFEAKFMLPWSFSEEAAAEKHMPQLRQTCGSPMPRPRFSRSLQAAANGWKSKYRLIRSTSTSC